VSYIHQAALFGRVDFQFQNPDASTAICNIVSIDPHLMNKAIVLGHNKVVWKQIFSRT
jgi:hypothetical protein